MMKQNNYRKLNYITEFSILRICTGRQIGRVQYSNNINIKYSQHSAHQSPAIRSMTLRLPKHTTPSVMRYQGEQQLESQLPQGTKINSRDYGEWDQFSTHCYYGVESMEKRGENMGTKGETGISELSLLIYEGLDDARKGVHSKNLANKMEQIYKKGLNMEIELCKQLQGLTMMAILKQKQMQIKIKQQNLEEDVANLRKQLALMQKSQKQNKSKSKFGGDKSINPENEKKKIPYNIIKRDNGTIYLEKHNECAPSTGRSNIVPRSQDQQEQALKNSKQNFYSENENYSTTSPGPGHSRASSFLTALTPRTPSSTQYNEKKQLLFQRMSIIKDQIGLVEQNFGRKIEMMRCQNQIIHQEIILVNESIDRLRLIKHKKQCLNTIRSRIVEDKSRNPRFKSSEGRRRSQKKSIFRPAKRSDQPRIFKHSEPEPNNPSPSSIYRCRSEYKVEIRKPSSQQHTKKFLPLNSNMQHPRHEGQTEYFGSGIHLSPYENFKPEPKKTKKMYCH